MNVEQFWGLIEKSRSVLSNSKVDGNFERQAEYIKDSLRKLDKKQIVEFDRIYHELTQRLYTWELWGAAYVIGGGCSDDGFMDFRSWIISLGKSSFELALRSPDDLGQVSQEPNVEDTFFEELAYVAEEVYEELFDEDLEVEYMYSSNPKGTEWDEGSVESLYPKLSAMYA